MPQPKHAMEIFQLLDKSNCRECGEKTCLAFAVAVFKEKKQITACPHLPEEVIARYGGAVEKPDTVDENKARAIEELKQKVAMIDLSEAAKRLGASRTLHPLDVRHQGGKCL